MVIGVRPGHEEAYRTAHRDVPPGVFDPRLQYPQLLDFSRDSVLYSYFEYVGTDFSSDMAKMAADPATPRVFLPKAIQEEKGIA